jgi:predicted Mrr-cat superfamily restriction endonuclease
VSENDEAIKSLTSLEVQVDRDGQVHAFTDANKTWTFVNPISVNDLVETYNHLLEETDEGLTSLKIKVDRDGQVHAFTDANKTWTFVNPISVNDLVKTYKEVLANVAFMELKGAR